MNNLKNSALTVGKELTREQMKNVTGGIAPEVCIIYTIDADSGHRMQYYQPVPEANKESAASSLYQITGQHAYWDCSGDGYQHTYYVS